jgi:molecular chaperone DnaK
LKDENADQEKLESAAKELNDKIMPIGAKMYEQAQKDESKDDKKSDKKSDDDDAVEGEVVDK